MKVVLIKSESDGPDKFVEKLQKNSFNVTSISSIDFQFKNLDKLNDILKNHSDSYDGMIFTSPRAVHALKNAVEQNDSTILNDWILKDFNYSVGEGTYTLVDMLLNMKTKGKEAGNALKLSSIIANDFKNRFDKRKLLFVCGNLKQDILERNLKDNAIDLDVIEVYETIQHPNLDSSINELKVVQFLVFFSPSSVNFSLPLISKHGIDISSIKIIAIGPSTEKCLSSNNIKCYVCDKPSPESLINFIKSCV
ncbi:hypothetical protein ACKWTF_009219 [Chironomus riparius]